MYLESETRKPGKASIKQCKYAPHQQHTNLLKVSNLYRRTLESDQPLKNAPARTLNSAGGGFI